MWRDKVIEEERGGKEKGERVEEIDRQLDR